MRGYTRGVAATFPNGRAKQRHGFVYSTAGGLALCLGACCELQDCCKTLHCAMSLPYAIVVFLRPRQLLKIIDPLEAAFSNGTTLTATE